MLPVRNLILLLAITLSFANCKQENQPKNELINQIEKVLKSHQGFSGVIKIAKNDTVLYSKNVGFSNIEEHKELQLDDQFVIGSISKQITAVLLMRAYEKGKIGLYDTISNHLPTLSASWKNKITVHHLLTHTHGIKNLTDTLQFHPGSQFQYSQLGYQLLSEILEEVNKSSFQKQAMDIFHELGMNNTFHPDDKNYKKLVKGYTQGRKDSLKYADNSLANYVAAGSFISNAEDLLKWNRYLQKGNIVDIETLNLMTEKYAIRDHHPIFDQLHYGYGLLYQPNEKDLQIGAFGYAPGFVSASYFYPKTGLNLVVLSNVALNLNDFRKTFKVHTEIMNLVKKTN